MRPALIALAAGLAACGGGGGGQPPVTIDASGPPPDAGPGDPIPVALEVAPADVTLELTLGSTPAAQAYTATARYSDGTTRNVTSEAAWQSGDIQLVRLEGTTAIATGEKGGRASITASWGTFTASGLFAVRLRSIRVVDATAAGAPDLFAAATDDPALAPAIAYPPGGVLVPPNLGDFETHWTKPAGTADRYEISATGPLLDLRAYYAGTMAETNVWRVLHPEDWEIVARSSRDTTFELRVRALASASPATAGASAPIEVGVSPEELKGGIYYWTTSRSGIMRHDFGTPGVAPEEYFLPEHTTPTNRCVGCHAISRDGTRLVTRLDGGAVGQFTVLDVATRTELFPTDPALQSGLAAFSPDADLLLCAANGDLTLRDPTTGLAVGTVPMPGGLAQPDWSPTGDRFVFVVTDTTSDLYFSDGVLYSVDVDPVTGDLGGGRVIASFLPDNSYYPAFSPDGEWVVFNRATGGAYNNADAQLYAVKADGSLPPILLEAADLGPGLTNSWPRWAPFMQTTGDEEPLMWFTFTSSRPFGVRTSGNPKQLWMAPFYPGRATVGLEPTAPAFRLPFQEVTTANHIGEMTREIVVVE